MLALLDVVLALDDGEYAKIAIVLDCIVDAGSRGTNTVTWFSKLSALLAAHVDAVVPTAC
jgi:hypothetical protein